MIVAKTNTGKIGQVLQWSTSVAFDKTRSDWCLLADNIDKPMRKRDVFWIPATCIVWRLTIEDLK